MVGITKDKRQNAFVLFKQGLKKCTKCKVIKPLSDYMGDSNKKDLHSCRCRVCLKKYKNKELAKKTLSKYRKANCTSEAYIFKLNNKDPSYRANYKNGVVLVRCYNCLKYFSPNNLDVQNFVSSKNASGYRNLYCSNSCKKHVQFIIAKNIKNTRKNT